MSRQFQCDGEGQNHSGQLFAIGLSLVEVGKSRKSRGKAWVNLGHLCKQCMTTRGVTVSGDLLESTVNAQGTVTARDST